MRFSLGIFMCLMLLLTGCGFHLRGAEPLAPPFHHLYLQSNDPYSELTRYLKQSLKLSQVDFASTATSSSLILNITEQQTQQLLGVGGTQQTRLYNLSLIVTYEITDPQGKILVPVEKITENRTVTIQASQVLGGSNEESNLYQQMRRAAVFDIMLRLASPKTTAAVNQQETNNENSLATARTTPSKNTSAHLSH